MRKKYDVTYLTLLQDYIFLIVAILLNGLFFGYYLAIEIIRLKYMSSISWFIDWFEPPPV